ncbi:MAG: sodium:solute symporter [Paludibacter sp.]|nr:sodium:solute symporter [Paludibacter sp.]
MSSFVILLLIISYFALLLFVSFITGRKSTDNKAFFTGNRKSPWWIVSIGMVGASISGVSFVSVPGMVGNIQFTYMQTVIGFFFGYLVIAAVLLPLYYKLNLTSIYTYLGERFGKYSYKTGASFFLISKTIGSAARLYVVALILQKMVFDHWNIPFYLTITFILVLIWIYTFRSGIKSIVWTDSLQTVVMVIALLMMVIDLIIKTKTGLADLTGLLWRSDMSRVFVFDDWVSKQNFFKQFFSGIFIVIVMTGLDQDMMQKNLSCKSLPEAQKNMKWYGFAFIPVNLLFLFLGFLILVFAAQNGIQLPSKGDEILPFFAVNFFNNTILFFFIIGIIAAAFSTADSALTALTTSFYVDILGMKDEEAKSKKISAKRIRMLIHGGIALLFIVIIMIFKQLNNKSVIDAIYIIVSYTYGPLLGLYSFGLFTKLKPIDRYVPLIAILSPLLCYGIDSLTQSYFNYAFGYELLLLNGGLTFTGLFITSKYGNKISRIRYQ